MNVPVAKRFYAALNTLTWPMTPWVKTVQEMLETVNKSVISEIQGLPFVILLSLEMYIMLLSVAILKNYIKVILNNGIWYKSGWKTSARPLANASKNLAGRVENRPGRVEFCIGYKRDYPIRASAKNF